MPTAQLDSKSKFSKAGGSCKPYAVMSFISAFIIGIWIWGMQPGISSLQSPDPKDHYYNLLVQGFQAGQLNLKRQVPPGFSQLANPYDPALNAAYASKVGDMSYYKGKLYLYFGVVPALVIFWPYAVLTRHYLPDYAAVLIFLSVGYLAASGLLIAIWRRYFQNVNFGVVAFGILVLGLVLGAQEIAWLCCRVYEVALSSGFAFTMLALAAIWNALHKPTQRFLWVLLASLAYGLAIGSRPTLVVASFILLIPVTQLWMDSGARRQIAWLLAAAVSPIAIVVLGLMLYNYLRFDNPLEFGYRYQLSILQQTAIPDFSLRYLGFDLRYYFWEPVRWSLCSPFLQPAQPWPSAFGHFGQGQQYYGGIIICNPLTFFALAVPLVWKGRMATQFPALNWFLAAVSLLFIAGASMMSFFLYANYRYEMDFLPSLMLLALVGLLSLECTWPDAPGWRYLIRRSWYLLMFYTAIFHILAALESHATADYFAGNAQLNQGSTDRAIAYYRSALAIEPRSAPFHLALGSVYDQTGMQDQAIQECQTALQIEPNFAEAQYDLGYSFLENGQMNEGTAHIERALEIEPDFLVTHFSIANNNLAWSLATNPDPAKRNGALAVKLAEGACQSTHYQTTVIVGTLAAAYAEAGRFDDAIATAKKAISLAQAHNEKDLFENNNRLLRIYISHQAYHQASSAK